jgi:hypothetical protein
MIPNYNEKRGYHFGIFDLRNHEWLGEEFCISGTDLRYDDLLTDIDKALATIDDTEDVDKIGDVLRTLDIFYNADIVAEAIEAVEGCGDMQLDSDREVALDALMDIINHRDLYQHEEAPMGLSCDDGSNLLLSYLGGAPLVTVVDSEWVTECAVCSPCCPQAGDLDSEGSFTCLCMSPQEMHEVAKGNGRTYVVRKIKEDCKLTGEEWSVTADKCERVDSSNDEDNAKKI